MEEFLICWCALHGRFFCTRRRDEEKNPTFLWWITASEFRCSFCFQKPSFVPSFVFGFCLTQASDRKWNRQHTFGFKRYKINYNSILGFFFVLGCRLFLFVLYTNSRNKLERLSSRNNRKCKSCCTSLIWNSCNKKERTQNNLWH